MKLLKIVEKDGTITRIRVAVDEVAHEIASFFRNEIGLTAMTCPDDPNEKLDNSEVMRGKYLLLEWRATAERLKVVN